MPRDAQDLPHIDAQPGVGHEVRSKLRLVKLAAGSALVVESASEQNRIKSRSFLWRTGPNWGFGARQGTCFFTSSDDFAAMSTSMLATCEGPKHPHHSKAALGSARDVLFRSLASTMKWQQTT